jgi:hypothetical protein
MSRKVITMEQKLAAVFADVARGRARAIQVCAELGISRDTNSRYRRGFAADGLAGLQPVHGHLNQPDTHRRADYRVDRDRPQGARTRGLGQRRVVPSTPGCSTTASTRCPRRAPSTGC